MNSLNKHKPFKNRRSHGKGKQENPSSGFIEIRFSGHRINKHKYRPRSRKPSEFSKSATYSNFEGPSFDESLSDEENVVFSEQGTSNSTQDGC